MVKILVTLLISTVILCSFSCAPKLQLNEISLVPQPKHVKKNNGTFDFTDQTKIFVDSDEQEILRIANYSLEQINIATGFEFSAEKYSGAADLKNYVLLAIKDKNNDLGEEGYSLVADMNSVIIEANKPAGLFYGVQTLRQLLPVEIESNKPVADINWEIPCVEIEDVPRFTWRGAHLDVCRHFFPKEFVKKFIDILAMHKLNTFHWHLTEDQGWRVEIKKYPKLTEIGAWRVDRDGIHWNERKQQQPGEKATYGGFYTQEDIKEIVAYAKSRFITVVPEIEMPGHAVAALASYPEYSCFGGPFTVIAGGYWPIKDIYCAGKEGTFEFLENILEEVIPLFPGEFFHIGADEAFKANWEKCPDCQRRIKEEGLKDEHELQSYFVKRIEKFLNARGKRLVGWDEILEGGLAPNATVMSWRGFDGGIKSANSGHDVVMSPTSFCYFDYYQAKKGEPLAIGGYLPLEKVYSFEPIPPGINPEKIHHILGGQANVWTEYISTPEHAEYMLLPRLCALAEVVWSPGELRDFDNFELRMQQHYDRMNNAGLNFRVPTPFGVIGETVIFEPKKFVFDSPLKNSKIRFTTDGSEPNAQSHLFTEPIDVSTNSVIKARTILPNGKMSHVVENKIFKVDESKNGMNYKYFQGNWEDVSTFKDSIPLVEGKCYNFNLDNVKKRKQSYGFIFKGFLKVEREGEYTFFTNSNDGSKLFINGSLVVSNDGLHTIKEESGKIKLKKGFHEIEVHYFQAKGLDILDVLYEGPKINKQPVPPANIYYEMES
jgi:hexosaminidase